MKNSILLIATLFLIYSCTNNDTQFEITLVETGTNFPIEDARVLVSGDRFTGDIDFPIIRSVIDTVYTDQNGYVKFSHKEDYDATDFLITKDQFFSISLTDEHSQIQEGEKLNYQFEMSGFAFLKFLIIDSETINESGIRFNPGWIGSSAKDYSIGNHELDGIIPSNKPHEYAYKLGENPLQKDFVTIERNDSLTIVLEY